MKGLAFRKLSRTTGHRNHLLRNLVTSLLHHERISTTVAKAKEAQREAEKIITKAKRAALTDDVRRGASQQLAHATGYVFARQETGPILQRLAERYAHRPGGYTRLHLHGHRPGDHAPRALLELVDNEKGDLKLEMTARAMARQLFLAGKRSKRNAVGGSGSKQPVTTITPDNTPDPANDERFNDFTRSAITKLLRYGGGEPIGNQSNGVSSSGGSGSRPSSTLLEKRRLELLSKADEHLRRLRIGDDIDGPMRVDVDVMSKPGWKEHTPRGYIGTPPVLGRRLKAGVDPLDMPERTSSGGSSASQVYEPALLKGRKSNSPIRLGKGAFARKPVAMGSRTTPRPGPSRSGSATYAAASRARVNPVAFKSAASGRGAGKQQFERVMRA